MGFEVRGNMTKNDLRDGDIVTLRNGDRLVYAIGNFFDLCRNFDNEITTLTDINEDLTRNNEYAEDEDIVKVERSTGYETVFVREEKEVKEMTIEEIYKALGYEVKIVKRH